MSQIHDNRARFDRDHPRNADTTVSGNPAETTVQESGAAGGDKSQNPEDIGSVSGGDSSGRTALNARDVPVPDSVVNDATVLNLPHPDTRSITPGMDNLVYPDPIQALSMIDSIAGHLEATLKKLDAQEDILTKTRMRGPVIQTADWATGTAFSIQVSNPVPEGEIWLVSPIIAYVTKQTDGTLAAVQLAAYVDAIAAPNFIGMVDSSRATWGSENLFLFSGQSIYVTSLVNAAQNNRVTVRMEVLTASADMFDTHARY
jgi:hypothetical protein